MKSIGQKIATITGLIGTKDLNDWETNFVRDIKIKTHDGKNTTGLTPKQAEAIERIHDKHFV